MRLGTRYLDSDSRLKCEVCGASPPRPATADSSTDINPHAIIRLHLSIPISYSFSSIFAHSIHIQLVDRSVHDTSKMCRDKPLILLYRLCSQKVKEESVYYVVS